MRFHNIENTGAVLIIGIEPDSPAKKTGLKEGDAIISINGHPVNSVDDVQRTLLEVSTEKPAKIIAIRLTETIQFDCHIEFR